MIAGLTAKEVCELRLKCLEPLIQTASKVGLEKGQILEVAEKHWEFMLKPIQDNAGKTTSTKRPTGESSEPKA